MRSEADHYRAVVTGRRSKAAGEYWENMIEATCDYYSQQGIAEIAKTPEPMRADTVTRQREIHCYFRENGTARLQRDAQGRRSNRIRGKAHGR